MRKLLLLPLLFVSSISGAQERNAIEVVDKAIQHAGGWSAWMGTRTIEFRKTIVRFDPDGKVKSTMVQFHKYALHPSPRMRIEWESNGSRGLMINDGQQAWKFVNGEPATSQEDINSARGNTFGSHYVFCMPFKLRDEGTHLADAGLTTLDDGTMVQKVRATYLKGTGDAGGMHTWTYMFEANTGRLLANHLEFAPGKYDWTEYYDEKPVGTLLLSTRRLGFNADANGKIGAKQSEITYDQIETNVDFPASYFKPPR